MHVWHRQEQGQPSGTQKNAATERDRRERGARATVAATGRALHDVQVRAREPNGQRYCRIAGSTASASMHRMDTSIECMVAGDDCSEISWSQGPRFAERWQAARLLRRKSATHGIRCPFRATYSVCAPRGRPSLFYLSPLPFDLSMTSTTFFSRIRLRYHNKSLEEEQRQVCPNLPNCMPWEKKLGRGKYATVEMINNENRQLENRESDAYHVLMK